MTRNRYLFYSLIAFALSVVPAALRAQEKAAPHNIYLAGRTIKAGNNARQWLDSVRTMQLKEPVQVLLHFSKLPTEQEKQILAQNGVIIKDYVPDNTYTAIVQPGVQPDIAIATPVYSIVNVAAEWKGCEYLWRQVRDKHGDIEVLVSFYPGIDIAAIKEFIGNAGGQIVPGRMEHYGSFKVTIAADRVKKLAAWYGVRNISHAALPVPLDIQSRASVKGNISNAPPAMGGYNLQGDSVTVGVGDNTAGSFHVDLKDRILNFNPAPLTHHGVHINGIVGGSGIVNPLAVGLTPHVRMVDHFFDFVLSATGDMYRDYNMTVANNSYTLVARECDYMGTYDAYSAYLDTMALEYPYVQHVFASGNDGFLNCGIYPDGFGTISGGYQPSKNTLLVGSVNTNYKDAFDESRGPMRDGRLKPEMVSIGLSVFSTIDYKDYLSASGTSMASPHVASGIAALTQRYKQLHGGNQPRADLMKTLMMNGCMDLGNPGPDYTYGFGVMNMYRSLQMLDNSHYLASSISAGDSQTFILTVPANTAMLKVMLYWNDAPASPSAAKQLVNDLDLTVRDAAGLTHLPLVLDHTPANVNNNATEKEDHLNNVEQVTILNPVAGNYVIKTKGHNIPAGPQQYVMAYDLLTPELRMTFPMGGEAVSNADSLRVYWEIVDTSGTFTLLFSPNAGSTWQTISDSIRGSVRRWAFLPSNVNSGKCIVRLIRNGTASFVTSGRFAVNSPAEVKYDGPQCPGYINIHWSPVPNATSYQLWRKDGPYMHVVDTATDTVYSFRNMSLKEYSYVAVSPVIDGLPAYRSVAAEVLANTGGCTNPVSQGDLMTERLVGPLNGRMFTGTAIGASASVFVRLRNLYTAPCNSYSLSYSINGGVWGTLAGLPVIPAAGTLDAELPGLPLGTPGSYHIVVAVTNLSVSDPNKMNDTLSFTIVNLPNDPLDLATPFSDDFETMDVVTVGHDSLGVSPNGHWDFFNGNDTGRMRSFLFDDITIGGNRSISLDEAMPVQTGSKNLFTGTFNLSAYDTGTAEVRMDFDYVLHGVPANKDGNTVYARGCDTGSWRGIFSYDFENFTGVVSKARSLSLTDLFRAARHNFTGSTGVAFGQSDVTLIGARNFGAGLTIDNFRLYTVANDAEMVKVIAPAPNNCGLPSVMPLTVQVRNGVGYTLYNVQLFYKADGGTTYTGIIDSIKAKDTVSYTFAQQLNVPPGTTHSITTWLAVAGDTYTQNDSIVNYKFRNSRIISEFPYLENFEDNDGGFYASGMGNSWQYGTPASPKINRAASGTKAWKTNLAGYYTNLEKSYLYSPCFDVSQLSNPMLSFSTAMDIENCGSTLCDYAYMEYTFDDETWNKLGEAGQGTNWYDSTFDVWNTRNFTRWHVASVPLPKPPAGSTLHLRYVMRADPSFTVEGVAVDDIHIYDLATPLQPSGEQVSVTQDVEGNQWKQYVTNSNTVAAVQPRNQGVNNTVATLYAHDTLTNPSKTQFTFPRSYTLKTGQADSMGIRLYLADEDVMRVLASTCPSCTEITDAYRLGITHYTNSQDTGRENGTLADDEGGAFSYIPYQALKWVPYDNGYYAEFTGKPTGEYWFNDGGPTQNVPAGIDYLSYTAFRHSSFVANYWYSLIDTAVDTYTIQWSFDGITFHLAKDTAALHVDTARYYFDDPINWVKYHEFYFRLRWTLTGRPDVYYYSPIVHIDSSDSASARINMDARMVDRRSVLVSWDAEIDAMVSHYVLERAIGNGSFTAIDTRAARKHFGQQYDFVDRPAEKIPSGKYLHYRLRAVLEDGTTIILPERLVEWTDNGVLANIYPNPAHNSFNIDWNAEAGTVMQLHITDAVGGSVFKATATASQWNNTTMIQAPVVSKGIYFIRLDIGGNRYTSKIVFE